MSTGRVRFPCASTVLRASCLTSVLQRNTQAKRSIFQEPAPGSSAFDAIEPKLQTMPPRGGTKLGAKWQLDAALLSRPVDLTALVSLSQTAPQDFFADDTLPRMVTLLLNAESDRKADKDTRLDVLTILANLSKEDGKRKDNIREALDGVNDWFDAFLAKEASGSEPELHKLMLLLLARCFEYSIKTEDLLELCRNDRALGLETVVGLLEDGETYTTELRRKQAPEVGRMGQWEHRLVCHRHETPLVLQLCRLVRGFTLPSSYFVGDDVSDKDIASFGDEMNLLLDITLKSRLVEKLSLACYECLFSAQQTDLQEDEHRSIACVHSFLQNMYFYATSKTEVYRHHLLCDTPLIQRLVLPYLERGAAQAASLQCHADSYGRSDFKSRQSVKPLAAGVSASLRTLVVASFRAPSTRTTVALLKRLNPTAALLEAPSFVAAHDRIFALLLLLNANMGALELGREAEAKDENPHELLHGLAKVYKMIEGEARRRVVRTVTESGALPVARDTQSFAAVLQMLNDGASEAQLEYVRGSPARSPLSPTSPPSDDDGDTAEEPEYTSRAEAKAESMSRARDAKSVNRSLLGDLPTLGRRRVDECDDDDYVEPALKVTTREASDVPREFACAINGHLLKEPARTPQGLVFERATIKLWLETRGSVCPITGEALTLAALSDDRDLRARIVSWQLSRARATLATSVSAAHGDEDDLYDF